MSASAPVNAEPRPLSHTWRALGSPDLIYACGGGLVAHPQGIAAGVRSLRQAWDAVISGIPLDDHARTHPELAQALHKFQS